MLTVYDRLSTIINVTIYIFFFHSQNNKVWSTILPIDYIKTASIPRYKGTNSTDDRGAQNFKLFIR